MNAIQTNTGAIGQQDEAVRLDSCHQPNAMEQGIDFSELSMRISVLSIGWNPLR
jgi:hypothetical protein